MLNAADITFERHYRPVFEPVSLRLGPGELLVVTGPNGSGKTTLLRLLAGLLRPDHGSLERPAAGTAFLGHQLAVKDGLTVRENLAFQRALAGDPRQDLEAALERFGLAPLAGREARTLSAGQRKRCALARLLLTGAPLWLLDEPYSNLDDAGTGLLDRLLGQHLDSGGACVLSTHGERRPAGIPARTLELREHRGWA